MEGNAGNIHPDIYQAYSDNLRKAVAGVFRSDDYGDRYFDLQAQLQSNVTRFAAYKAYHLTEQLKKQREKWTDDDEYKKVAKSVLNTFNRYQAAEYNTATARARTAKQWTDFTSDPIANELYPNLKWLPSRSANPREEHMVFYNRVWAKSDPFWSENQPGNLWNCKCDWEETDDPVTDSNPTDAHHAKGLEGNPAETGEIFGENCTYFQQAGNNTGTAVIRTVREINREKYSDIDLHFNTSIGNVLVDNITIQEITKGAKTDKSYFYKQEIALNFDKYISLFTQLPDEEIDLSHNNHRSIFYQRKKLFSTMKVYKISIHGYEFQVKIGEFKTGGLNLYTITEPY
jgi:hypothetical protein